MTNTQHRTFEEASAAVTQATRLAAQLDRTALRLYEDDARRRAFACDDAIAHALDAAKSARRSMRYFESIASIPDLTAQITTWVTGAQS